MRAEPARRTLPAFLTSRGHRLRPRWNRGTVAHILLFHGERAEGVIRFLLPSPAYEHPTTSTILYASALESRPCPQTTPMRHRLRVEAREPVAVRVLCAGDLGPAAPHGDARPSHSKARPRCRTRSSPPPPRPHPPLRVLMPLTSSLFHPPRSTLLPQTSGCRSSGLRKGDGNVCGMSGARTSRS
jgi:hypothetical protein